MAYVVRVDLEVTVDKADDEDHASDMVCDLIYNRLATSTGQEHGVSVSDFDIDRVYDDCDGVA